ncbi:hypothetical protein [Escherichia coli]|uniref:hypothetical protein n=1 Tax=Escherichia coli TaxID=562 RepID=UPI00207BC23A|nr:hypothetical protein [Escherichia coli]
MLLNWQGRHFMEINHSRITSYEIADYMIRTKSLLSAKELAAILEKEYPHLDVDKRDVYLRLQAVMEMLILKVYQTNHGWNKTWTKTRRKTKKLPASYTGMMINGQKLRNGSTLARAGGAISL